MYISISQHQLFCKYLFIRFNINTEFNFVKNSKKIIKDLKSRFNRGFKIRSKVEHNNKYLHNNFIVFIEYCSEIIRKFNKVIVDPFRWSIKALMKHKVCVE